MSILSDAIVVVAVVSPMFISAVKSILEYLACANIYISKAFRWMSAFKLDGILKKLDLWRELHTSNVKPFSASTPVPEFDNACLGTDNLHHKNHTFFDLDLGDLGSLWLGRISQNLVPTSGHLNNGPTFGSLHSEVLLLNWHCFQVANIEILDFINEVRSWREFLFKRMSAAVSILNGKIDSMIKQIVMEHERVSAELPTFLDAEVRELRDALDTQFQNEDDHHILGVKNSADNLERARRRFPDPGGIEAECKGLQSVFQRWRQRMGNFLEHASSEAERSDNIQIPVKRIMELPEKAPTAQATQTKYEAMQDKVDKNEPASLTVSEKQCSEAEEPISTMGLWATASGYPAPTPAEIEEGRRIRRERVAKRLTENNGQRYVRSESGPRKHRCLFRNRLHGLHKQDHAAARQSLNLTLH